MALLLRVGRSYGLQLVTLVAVCAYFSATTPLFRGIPAAYSVVEGFGLLGLVAAGMSLTVFAGELDLSVSAMAGLAGVVAVRTSGLGLVACLVLATLVGAVIGVVQGTLIDRLRLNSLVLTVGSQIALGGLAYVLSGNADVELSNLSISDFLLHRWSFFSPESALGLIILGILGLYLSFARLGRETQALGGGRREAEAAGVSSGSAIVVAFAVSAACAALAGAVASVKGGGASPTGYSDLLLNAPAAILIGGVALQDGKGTMFNVFLGVAILSALTAGLGDRGVQSYVVDLVIGAVLMVLVIGQFVLSQGRNRSIGGPLRILLTTGRNP
jgi:ribose/xylose/arabinose/galactoside ABC-type transport system permease subunit